MKKIVSIGFLSFLCLAWCAATIFASDDETTEWSLKFKPAMSFGYASSGETHLIFTNSEGGTLVGVINQIDIKVPEVSGMYLAGELPVAFHALPLTWLDDRITLTVSGRWVFPDSDNDVEEDYGIVGGGLSRHWNSNQREWLTFDTTLSYAVLKDFSFVKDISAVVGCRWDRQKISYESPYSAAPLLPSASTDTVDFEMNSYTPIFGLTATFKGPKAGMFGGDIKVGAFGSPLGGGSIKYRELLNLVGAYFEFNGDLDDCSFYKFNGEMPIVSRKIGSIGEASLSIFGEYTQFFTTSKANGTSRPVSPDVKFDFKTRPSLAAIGVKAALAF